MIGVKVITRLRFAICVLFFQFRAKTRPKDLRPFLISETGLSFLIWTQGEIRAGKRASPVDWAHMKRPLMFRQSFV